MPACLMLAPTSLLLRLPLDALHAGSAPPRLDVLMHAQGSRNSRLMVACTEQQGWQVSGARAEQQEQQAIMSAEWKGSGHAAACMSL